MYGKYLPKRVEDAHFDILFDYEGRAEAVRRANQALHDLFAEGFRNGQAEDPRHPDFVAAHKKIVKTFRSALTNAYPPGFWEDFERLRKRNPTGLPIAIEFLEADPWFFRSGYVKERLIRYIIRLDLSVNFSARLRKVVLAVVDKGDRREFRDYCRLARKVDSPEFRNELHARLQNDNPGVRRRTQWVLDSLEKGVRKKGKFRERRISRNQIPLSPHFLEHVETLRLGQPKELEWAFSVLEDIFFDNREFDRPGMIRGKLIAALADITLPVDYKPRAQKLILSVVDTGYLYAFDRYCHLAHQLDSAEFRQELAKRLQHPDYHVRRRAGLVIMALPNANI